VARKRGITPSSPRLTQAKAEFLSELLAVASTQPRVVLQTRRRFRANCNRPPLPRSHKESKINCTAGSGRHRSVLGRVIYIYKVSDWRIIV